MKTKELTNHQKHLAAQVLGFIEQRDLMIQTAVNRANNYLNIINSGAKDTATQFMFQQRKIVKAQPIPMDKKVEGADYLPAARHAFKGVPMSKAQIIKSVESEKQRNMGYLLAALLPVSVNEFAVMHVINANPAPSGIIDTAMIKQYLSARLMSFLSFAHYQNVLSKFGSALAANKEIVFSNHGLRDKNEIAYLVDHLYIFDFLYAQRNNLTYIEDVAQTGGFMSNLMTIHTGSKLDQLTGIDIKPSLRGALRLALTTGTVSTANKTPQKAYAS